MQFADSIEFEDLFKVMRYPAGEPHVELIATAIWTADLVIECDCRNFDDLFIVGEADAILKRKYGIGATFLIPYFPFSRHDRRRDINDSNPLQSALEWIKFRDISVITVDPHSDVTAILPHIPQKEIVRSFMFRGLFKSHDTIAIIPDIGATKKAETWAWEFGIPTLQAYKHRDPVNGQLSGFSIDNTTDIKGMNAVIVDDICDGGGTFLGLAAVLRSRGVRKITLAVSHGLFTKGFKPFNSVIDEIMTFKTEPSALYDEYLGNIQLIDNYAGLGLVDYVT